MFLSVLTLVRFGGMSSINFLAATRTKICHFRLIDVTDRLR